VSNASTTPRDGDEEAIGLVMAFPPMLRKDVTAALEGIGPLKLSSGRSILVSVEGSQVVIPYRIYGPEPPPGTARGLSTVQQAAVHCIYTRHHDGFVRQRHLRAVIDRSESWIVPFVVQLVGEYVIEILNDIADALDLATPESPASQRFGRFVIENPQFFETTCRRVVSYWNAYYRRQWPHRDLRSDSSATYPGFLLIDGLRAAGRAFQASRGRRTDN
jgi:hypothetical protein